MVSRRRYEATVLMILAFCCAVVAQEPFITYNKTIPIGQSGYVRWDSKSFAGPVNLWLQQLAPNASAPQVPLDYSNTKGFFLWAAGTNLKPGQYFYQLQSVGGHGIIFKSNPLILVCADCPVESDDGDAFGAGDGDPLFDADDPRSAKNGINLSPGAAAGIGVAGSFALVAIVLAVFLIVRRRRKRKRDWGLKRPSMAPSHPPSFTMTAPPSQSFSPYDPPLHGHRRSVSRPGMAMASKFGSERIYSHELDSSGKSVHSPVSTEHPRWSGATTRQLSWQSSGNTIAAEPPLSTRPPLSTHSSHYRHPSHTYGSLPLDPQNSPGRHYDGGSYTHPSQRTSPNIEQAASLPHDAAHQWTGSPDRQQPLVAPMTTGSPTSTSHPGSQRD